MNQRIALASLLCACIGCAAPARHAPEVVGRIPGAEVGGVRFARPPAQDELALPFERPVGLPWSKGQALAQGFFGVTHFSEFEVEGGNVDGDEGDLDQLPVLGGGGQWKLGGDRVALGLEGLLSFAWRADAKAFATGGGGAVVAVDVDVLIFELFGGPFASVFLNDHLRLYGGAGPLMQWAEYDQSGPNLDGDGSGFGSGWYARTGLEFVLPSGTLIGFGVRWSDTRVDLDNGLGDLEIDGFQGVVTVSQGLY